MCSVVCVNYCLSVCLSVCSSFIYSIDYLFNFDLWIIYETVFKKRIGKDIKSKHEVSVVDLKFMCATFAYISRFMYLKN